MVNPIRAVFGPADIILNLGQPDEVRFDGESRLQFEQGEVTLEPQFAEITSVDTGGGAWDDYFTHFTGTVVISGFEDDLETFRLALGGLQAIETTEGEGVRGYSDAPVGASNRARGVTVDIAPRGLFGKDSGEHIHIYKASSTASYNRSYGNEQGGIAIEMKIYPKDNADFKNGDNFFRKGHDDIIPTLPEDPTGT